MAPVAVLVWESLRALDMAVAAGAAEEGEDRGEVDLPCSLSAHLSDGEGPGDLLRDHQEEVVLKALGGGGAPGGVPAEHFLEEVLGLR